MNLFFLIVQAKFLIGVHRSFHWIAIFQFELLKKIICIPLLRNKNSNITLLYFQPKKITHQLEINHLKFTKHHFFKFLHWNNIVININQLINIKANNKNLIHTTCLYWEPQIILFPSSESHKLCAFYSKLFLI